jgi:DNA-binding PadR family transcriptional regulator
MLMDHKRYHRHRMGPPRGMLRHIALQIIKVSPMSGSELMDEIERHTEWRPSPGSVYPLLAHLNEDGLIDLLEDDDSSLKRFQLTDAGERELEEHLRFDEQFRKRNKTMRKIYWRLHRGMPEDVYNSFAELIDQIEGAYQETLGDPKGEEKLVTLLEDTIIKLKNLRNNNE